MLTFSTPYPADLLPKATRLSTQVLLSALPRPLDVWRGVA